MSSRAVGLWQTLCRQRRGPGCAMIASAWSGGRRYAPKSTSMRRLPSCGLMRSPHQAPRALPFRTTRARGMKSVLWRAEIVKQLAFLVKCLLGRRTNAELEKLVGADPVKQPVAQVVLRAADERNAEAAVAMLVAQCKGAGAFVADCRGYTIVVETIWAVQIGARHGFPISFNPRDGWSPTPASGHARIALGAQTYRSPARWTSSSGSTGTRAPRGR